MKKIVIIFIMSLSIFGCSKNVEVSVSEKNNELVIKKVGNENEINEQHIYNSYIDAYNVISTDIYKIIKEYNYVFGLKSKPNEEYKGFSFFIEDEKTKDFFSTLEKPLNNNTIHKTIEEKDLYLSYINLEKSAKNIWNAYISSLEYYADIKNKQDGYNNSEYLHNDFIKNYNIFMYDYNIYEKQIKSLFLENAYKQLYELDKNELYIHYRLNRLITLSNELLESLSQNDIINIDSDYIHKSYKDFGVEMKKINKFKEKELKEYGFDESHLKSMEEIKIKIKRLYDLIELLDKITDKTNSDKLDNVLYNNTIIKYENVLKEIIIIYNSLN